MIRLTLAFKQLLSIPYIRIHQKAARDESWDTSEY
jgi:hypothetical protein